MRSLPVSDKQTAQLKIYTKLKLKKAQKDYEQLCPRTAVQHMEIQQLATSKRRSSAPLKPKRKREIGSSPVTNHVDRKINILYNFLLFILSGFPQQDTTLEVMKSDDCASIGVEHWPTNTPTVCKAEREVQRCKLSI